VCDDILWAELILEQYRNWEEEKNQSDQFPPTKKKIGKNSMRLLDNEGAYDILKEEILKEKRS